MRWFKIKPRTPPRIVTVVIKNTWSNSYSARKAHQAIEYWTGQGYDLISDTRVTRLGGSLVFQRKESNQ